LRIDEAVVVIADLHFVELLGRGAAGGPEHLTRGFGRMPELAQRVGLRRGPPCVKGLRPV
jgi:hypothetical protein